MLTYRLQLPKPKSHVLINKNTLKVGFHFKYLDRFMPVLHREAILPSGCIKGYH